MKNITDTDYRQAKNLGEYHDLQVQSDTLIVS